MTSVVQTFFENYAEALMSFSAENVTNFYQTPLAIYSDQGVQTVQEMSEVLSFWGQGLEPYRAQNIEKAMPSVLTEEQLSEKVFISKVLWNNYDNLGKEVSNETNFYILSQGDEGLKISGLIIMTK